MLDCEGPILAFNAWRGPVGVKGLRSAVQDLGISWAMQVGCKEKGREKLVEHASGIGWL